MYIVKYVRKDNGKLLGYHLDTFGNLGSKEHAKKYGNTLIDSEENKQSQINTIKNNLQYRLNVNENSWLYEFCIKQKVEQYENLNINDIDILVEDIEYEPQSIKVHTIINDDGTVNVNNL